MEQKSSSPSPIGAKRACDAVAANEGSSENDEISSPPKKDSRKSLEIVDEKEKKFKIVLVLGGPGSGKGTNCARIVKDFGYVHLSAGDLLREERKSGSDTAKLIEDRIKNGLIVPSEITVGLLMQAMERSTHSNKFLIDGFPRDMGNQTLLEEIMAKDCEVQFLLFLDCPEEEMVTRLLKRGETSGRSDDNIESIRKRLQTYSAQTMPIVELYRQRSLIREFNSNRDEEAVYSDVRACFAEANSS